MISKLSILIPAYNEANTIHLILDKVKAVKLINGLSKQIIIINDCSKDNTKAIIESYKKDNPEIPKKLRATYWICQMFLSNEIEKYRIK